MYITKILKKPFLGPFFRHQYCSDGIKMSGCGTVPNLSKGMSHNVWPQVLCCLSHYQLSTSSSESSQFPRKLFSAIIQS